MNVSRTQTSFDSGRMPAEAALEPRPEGPTLRRATRRSEVDALLALIDVLEREPTPAGAFASLVDLVRPVAALDIIALVEHRGSPPLVSFASGLEELRPKTLALIDAAERYFRGDGSIDDYVSLTASQATRWISLPLSNEKAEILGLMIVASSAPLTETTLAFLACVARHFARTVARAKVDSVVPESDLLRERDAMLSTVSHDLQNPLGVILMSAAYLLEGMPTNDRRRAGRAQVEAIHRNARRMKRLVTDILDFDSIEAGRMAMTPSAVHPRKLINAALEDSELAASSAGVALRRGAIARLPLVWADTERILQVLLNLLTNAIKFTPRGGRVGVRARQTSDTEVTFYVQDNGVGISAEELPYVFERHWQSPASGEVRKNGCGLGLAICKSLVELSRGRIWAESHSGRGTSMMFSLPIATMDGRKE